MAGNMPVQAEVQCSGINLLNEQRFSTNCGRQVLSPLTGRGRILLAAFGVPVVVAAEARRYEARRPIADRAAVDTHDRQNGLAR